MISASPLHQPVQRAPRVVRPAGVPRENNTALLRGLINEAAARYCCHPRHISGPSQEKRFVDARTFVAHGLRQRGWTLQRIGDSIGRDHTSILHLLSKEIAPPCGDQLLSRDPKNSLRRKSMTIEPDQADRIIELLEQIAEGIDHLTEQIRKV